MLNAFDQGGSNRRAGRWSEGPLTYRGLVTDCSVRCPGHFSAAYIVYSWIESGFAYFRLTAKDQINWRTMPGVLLRPPHWVKLSHRRLFERHSPLSSFRETFRVNCQLETYNTLASYWDIWRHARRRGWMPWSGTFLFSVKCFSDFWLCACPLKFFGADS